MSSVFARGVIVITASLVTVESVRLDRLQGKHCDITRHLAFIKKIMRRRFEQGNANTNASRIIRLGILIHAGDKRRNNLSRILRCRALPNIFLGERADKCDSRLYTRCAAQRFSNCCYNVNVDRKVGEHHYVSMLYCVRTSVRNPDILSFTVLYLDDVIDKTDVKSIRLCFQDERGIVFNYKQQFYHKIISLANITYLHTNSSSLPFSLAYARFNQIHFDFTLVMRQRIAKRYVTARNSCKKRKNK